MAKNKNKSNPEPQKSKKERKREKILRKKQQQRNQSDEDDEPVVEEPPVVQEQEQNQDREQNSQQEHSQDDLDLHNVIQGEHELLDIEFLIAEITENHYHSMKTILEKLAQNTKILSSDLADVIIKNKEFGNLVDIEEDDDEEDGNEEDEEEGENNREADEQDNLCHGIINLLPFNKEQCKAVTKKLMEKIIKSAQSNKKIEFKKYPNPKSLFSSIDSSYILLNERAINLPPFVAVNMHKVLVSDIQHQIPNPQKFNVLVISQIEKVNKKTNSLQDIVFTKFQDYEFAKNSQMAWAGEVVQSPYRKNDRQLLYYIINLAKYFQIVKQELQKIVEDA